MVSAQAAVDAGVYGALAAHTLLNTAVGGRIYEGKAPAGSTYPYVIFQQAGGGDVFDSQRRNIEVQYLVIAISGDQPEALTLAGYIQEAMIDAGLTITGWANYVVAPGDFYTADDNESGHWAYMRGQFFRIGFDKE